MASRSLTPARELYFQLITGRKRNVKPPGPNAHVLAVTLLFFISDDLGAGTGSSTTSEAEPNLMSNDQSTVAGDSDAEWRRHRFRMLYDANYDDLWRYCLRRAASPQEAEDALNETFTIAWRRLDVVPTGDGARPWLFGVARNQLRSGWRKYNRADELRDRLVDAHTSQPSPPDPGDIVADGSSTILKALSTLREKDQEILRLAAWEELPHGEIATLLGCSENAVSIRIHRARNRLVKAIAKQQKSTPVKNFRENVKVIPTSSHVVDEPATTTEGGLA